MRLNALCAAILFAASAAPALAADSPSQRWEAWRQLQLAGPAEQAMPRLAWAYFGDGGIPADQSGFHTYAQAGFTHVQVRFNPPAIAAAEKENLKLFLGTWENAVGNDDKVHALDAKAQSDSNVSIMMLKDEAEAPAFNDIGHDNDLIYSETPSRVLPLQTILPAHASKPGNAERFDPTKPCKAAGSYCDFVKRAIDTEKPAAIGITLYPLLSGGDRSGYERELEQIRKQTQSAKIGMFGFVLTTPHYDGWSKQRYKQPDLSDILFQVNSLLANNAKAIAYYNYRIKPADKQESHGAFAEGLVSSSDGQPTDTYGYVQKANCEIAGVGATLLNLDVHDTYRPDENKGRPIVASTKAGQVTVNGDDLLVSTLEPLSGSGSSWIMVVNGRHGAGSSATTARLQLPAGTQATLTKADGSCHVKRTSLGGGNTVSIQLQPGDSNLIELAHQ